MDYDIKNVNEYLSNKNKNAYIVDIDKFNEVQRKYKVDEYTMNTIISMVNVVFRKFQ